MTKTIDALVEALEYWLPKAEPLPNTYDKVCEHHKNQWKKAVAALAQARAEQAEPLFWYRPVCHGEMYEGPIHNNSVGGKMLREEKPGEWLPLFAAPPAAPAKPLHQALTDPENQPNQYGVEFLMHGQKMAFKVGAQQFTLDYEPTEPGEFEFMRDCLIHALSIFTPDVKTAAPAKLEPLSRDEIDAIWRYDKVQCGADMYGFVRAIEAAHSAKLGGA